jgi:hypothetical protein
VHPVARHQEARSHLLRANACGRAVLVLSHELHRLSTLHLTGEVLTEELLELTLSQAHRGRERLSTPAKSSRATSRPPEKSGAPVIGSAAASTSSATPV